MSGIMDSVIANKEQEITSELTLLRNISDALIRSRYAAALGQSYGGARDLYNILGYQKSLKFEDFWNMYKRGRLGARVIDAPIEATWQGELSLSEDDENEETDFEKAFEELNKKCQLLPKFIRFDKLASLGEYAVLLLGFNDGASLDQPIGGGTTTGKKQLLYVQPYHQAAAQIVEWDTDPKSPRYSLPVMYNIGITQSSLFSSSPTQNSYIKVHYTRIMHLAHKCLDNDVFGTPTLEPGFNTLADIEKIGGGSAEMYWQGAISGKAFSTQKDVTLGADSLAAMQDEIDEYTNGIRRYMRLQGMDVHDLSSGLVDPKGAMDVQLDIVAGIYGMPKRILVGSERGELASSQDRDNWLSRVQNRREQTAEPMIVRPFVDYMIKLGVLPPVKNKEGKYKVDWEDLWSTSDKEEADVSNILSTALKNYVTSPGADQVIPVEIFLEKFLGFSADDIKRVQDIIAKQPKVELTPDEIQALIQSVKPTQTQGGEVTGKKPLVALEEWPLLDSSDTIIVIGNAVGNPYRGKDGKYTTGPSTAHPTGVKQVTIVGSAPAGLKASVQSELDNAPEPVKALLRQAPIEDIRLSYDPMSDPSFKAAFPYEHIGTVIGMYDSDTKIVYVGVRYERSKQSKDTLWHEIGHHLGYSPVAKQAAELIGYTKNPQGEGFGPAFNKYIREHHQEYRTPWNWARNEELIEIEEEFYDFVDNYNPNHDPHSGEFTTGPGGAEQQASDTANRDLAKSRGYTVPPAWHHVYVNSDPQADLQVTGIDSKGRKQYIYSAEASNRNSAQKFARLKQFSKDYPEMMKKIESDAAGGSEEAKVLSLISKTGFRIGGERETGAEKQAFGASTLLGSHVSVHGNKVTFNFVGKKGVVQNHIVDDASVARWVSNKGPQEKLFNTTSAKVRDYLHRTSGKDYKVKDFRTHVATTTALQTMKGMSKPTSQSAFVRAVNSVAKVVSQKLGNTPAMAKNAYINPAVWSQWRFAE